MQMITNAQQAHDRKAHLPCFLVVTTVMHGSKRMRRTRAAPNAELTGLVQ